MRWGWYNVSYYCKKTSRGSPFSQISTFVGPGVFVQVVQCHDFILRLYFLFFFVALSEVIVPMQRLPRGRHGNHIKPARGGCVQGH